MLKKGTLFIVGTPIGNLDDITLRALDTLKKVNIIACEDTRTTIKLLNNYDIKNKKLISYHNFNEKQSSNKIINLLTNGEDIALVSDAGMPTIADPGYEIMNLSRKNEINIEMIPGVSALTTAIALSNFGNEFTFLGFGKQTKSKLIKQITELSEGTYVFFVAPHKLEFLIKTINEHKKDSKIFLAKELTKKFEKHFYGSPSDVLNKIEGQIKGEFTLVLKIDKPKKKVKINKYKMVGEKNE